MTTTEPNFGTYTRDGVERVAQSLEHAVRYEFDGWSKVGDAAGDAVGTDTAVTTAKATKATKAAGKPAE